MKSLRASDVKKFNRINVIRAIQGGAASRAEISAIVGLSKPSISVIVDELIARGWVREIGPGPSTEAGGKKPILLQFNYERGLIAAAFLNFHKKEIELAVTDLAGDILEVRRQRLDVRSEYSLVFHEIVTEIQALIQVIRAKGKKGPIEALSIAISGLVDTELGVLKYSSAVPEWSDVPVKEYFYEALGVPVFVENDARASALAELQFGGGAGKRTFACIQADMGIGTGVVIADQVFRGANYGAVTFAHTTIMHDGPRCKCGNRGCWETLASLEAFLKELGRRNAEYQGIDMDSALRLYRSGDAIVRETLIDFTGYWLGVGIANLLNVFNPEFVVIQGKLTETDEHLLNKVREVALEKAIPVARAAEFSFSKVKDYVQLRGAAAIVIQSLFSH
jgi:N-acetylglucosamine repressor